jgi:hypothetical protein
MRAPTFINRVATWAEHGVEGWKMSGRKYDTVDQFSWDPIGWMYAREAESKRVVDEPTASWQFGAHHDGSRDTTDARGSDQMRHCRIPKYARVRDRAWEVSSRLPGSGLLVEKGLCGSRLVASRVDVPIFFCNPSILYRNGNCSLRLAMVRPDTLPSSRVGGFSGGLL